MVIKVSESLVKSNNASLYQLVQSTYLVLFRSWTPLHNVIHPVLSFSSPSGPASLSQPSLTRAKSTLLEFWRRLGLRLCRCLLK